MLKTIATISTAAIILTGCISSPTPAPYDWRRFVVPLANNEYRTDAQSPNEARANELALKAAYSACEPGRPIIIEQTTTRKGLMTEEISAVYEVAHNAANLLGQWSPSLNDEEFSAEWLFRCDTPAI